MADQIRKPHRDSQPSLFDDQDDISVQNGPNGTAVMFCDGACSGNPGKSGVGVVINISDEDVRDVGLDRTYTISEYIGIATNNIAEYTALIRGLEKASSLDIKHLEIYLDSELLVRQVNGVYKVKNKKLIPLFNRIKSLLGKFDTFSVTHVRREFNKEADALATSAVSRA